MGGKNSNSSMKFGLRVLKITQNSPGFNAGIEPFFDFILSLKINEKKNDFSKGNTDENSLLKLFYEIINENLEKSIEFSLFNVFSQKKRQITIIPSKNWENADSSLGILVRIEEIDDILAKTFKILHVLPNSPSNIAGFIANEDFILGMTYYKYREFSEFLDILLEENAIFSKEICVFNEKTQEIRYIVMKSDKNWGGKGVFGCEFGFGIINQLKPCLETVGNSNEMAEINDKNEKSSDLHEKNSRKYKEITNKMKIPPKNPFNYPKIYKKPSFEKSIIEKEKNDKDFIEIAFKGIEKFENPPSKEEIAIFPLKKPEKTDVSSNNSSFLMSLMLENEKICDKNDDKNKGNGYKTDDKNKENGLEKENKAKIITKYSFFARKIKRDYIINSNDLFKLDIPIN